MRINGVIATSRKCGDMGKRSGSTEIITEVLEYRRQKYARHDALQARLFAKYGTSEKMAELVKVINEEDAEILRHSMRENGYCWRGFCDA